MVEFRITGTDGKHIASVKAKYLGCGRYTVRKLRTANVLGIRTITAKLYDGGRSYEVTDVYPDGELALRSGVRVEVAMSRRGVGASGEAV